jgi:hypothetical protein
VTSGMHQLLATHHFHFITFGDPHLEQEPPRWLLFIWAAQIFTSAL